MQSALGDRGGGRWRRAQHAKPNQPVAVRDGDHLREVNEGQLALVAEEQVEFVEVTVNQAFDGFKNDRL